MIGDDVVAQIVINLHANGAMSVSGNIGDVNLAVGMVDHARDAIKGKFSPKKEIIIPNYDVTVKQSPLLKTREMGDMKPHELGDMVRVRR